MHSLKEHFIENQICTQWPHAINKNKIWTTESLSSSSSLSRAERTAKYTDAVGKKQKNNLSKSHYDEAFLIQSEEIRTPFILD